MSKVNFNARIKSLKESKEILSKLYVQMETKWGAKLVGKALKRISCELKEIVIKYDKPS